jgi:hypothetical protein
LTFGACFFFGVVLLVCARSQRATEEEETFYFFNVQNDDDEQQQHPLQVFKMPFNNQIYELEEQRELLLFNFILALTFNREASLFMLTWRL